MYNYSSEAMFFFFDDPEGLVSVLAMATGNSSSSFEAFTQLIIDQSNVAKSWKKFSDKFLLALELRELETDLLCYQI